MSGTIDVDPATLEEHAADVRNYMSQIEGATANAGDTLDPQTFGLACVVPAQILQVWIQGADEFIKQAVAAGNHVADAVSSMAETYRENEAAQAGSFSKLQLGLEGGS